MITRDPSGRTRLTGDEYRELTELMQDAERCPRLSAWEEGFCVSIRAKLGRERTETVLTSKQIEALARIEAKVYPNG